MSVYTKASFRNMDQNDLRKEIKVLKQLSRKRTSRYGPSPATYAKGLRIAERTLLLKRISR